MKTHYELLEISPDAPLEEVKRAFRRQIARYHPDKVQHLGQEFHDMALGRAAALTEAYRVLSDDTRRAEYDAALAAGGGHRDQRRVVESPVPSSVESPAPDRGAGEGESVPRFRQFAEDRVRRDEVVRQAILARFRHVLTAALGTGYAESPENGSGVSFTPKARLLARARGPRLVGRFVARVDSASVTDAWAQAAMQQPLAVEGVCVILMGIEIAPAHELAAAIALLRRRQGGARVTLIPVNASTWDAYIPTDAPGIARQVLDRLRAGI